MLKKEYTIGTNVIKIEGFKAHLFEVVAAFSFLIGVGSLPLPDFVHKADFDLNPYAAFAASVVFERYLFLLYLKYMSNKKAMKNFAMFATVGVLLFMLVLPFIASFFNKLGAQSLVIVSFVVSFIFIVMLFWLNGRDVLVNQESEQVIQERISAFFKTNYFILLPISVSLLAGYFFLIMHNVLMNFAELIKK